MLFIENTGARSPRLQDIGRIRERIVNWFNSIRGFTEVQSGLTVFSPIFLPFPYSRLARFINRHLLSRSVRQWMRSAHFSDPIAFTFLPTPLAQALIRDVNSELVIYYCVDNMAGSSPEVQQLRPWEDILFRDSDLVLVTSTAIFERAKTLARNVYSFPSGVEFEKFASALESSSVPDDLASLQRPIIGYIGALSGVLDQNLILEMALNMPFATFAFVGPFFTDVTLLKSCPNIKLLGARPHNEVPAYVKAFDVALIPYLITMFTDSVYSCKLNEYLAMGKPVVSTNIREVRLFAERYPGAVAIGLDDFDFVNKVKDALREAQMQSQEIKEMRISVAKENTWDKRFTGIMDVVDRELLLKSKERASWKESLSRYYSLARTRWLTGLASGVLLYLLIFNTPLVWFAGNQLVVRHLPRNVDAIVVFSGDGESSYRNASYQRRALDAVCFYKQHYAPTIFLSSGKEQPLSEVEVIKLYLIEKGVEKSAIHILDKFPHSTHQNVKMVSHELQANGVRSILFLTSPYHGRRALWIWRKQNPTLVVLTPSVIDTPPATPQWSASVDQIRVITYEYAAIVYNWCRDWL